MTSDSRTTLSIAILDDYQGAIPELKAFSKLAGRKIKVLRTTAKSVDDLAAQLQGFDVIVPVRERTVINKELLSKLPDLKMISQSGKGVAHIDVEECTRRGIAVAASGGNPYAPAELTWALILASMRNIPAEAQSAKEGKWQTSPIGTQLRGRKLGIYGYGSIGSIVASYGKAFGMQVVVWGREGSLDRARKDGLEVPASREAFFAECDVVSVHLRLSAESRGSITAQDLSLMKSTALFVNTSRADLVAPRALEKALAQGHPGFAAVDTYEEEPAERHPLFALKNALCVPHLGYVERDTYEVFFGGAFDNVLAFEAGKPENIVNPPSQ